MLDYEQPGLDFNHDHILEVGPESCMCNFGISYEASYGHSGHLSLVSRALPDQPRARWPLAFWDEEEQEGTHFVVREGAWLSGWLARFCDWPDDLSPHRASLIEAGRQGGDPDVAVIFEGMQAGEMSPALLYARAAPESLLARCFGLARAQRLSLGRPAYHLSDPAARAQARAEWAPLLHADPLLNLPAAFSASLGFTTDDAWGWLRRNLKYDVGGSCGVSDFTFAAAKHLLEHDPDASSPYWPVLQAYSEDKWIGGDPWCAVGRALLAKDEHLAAITAFENAILFERGWSEEFHTDALEGIREAAKQRAAPDYLAYLDSEVRD